MGHVRMNVYLYLTVYNLEKFVTFINLLIVKKKGVIGKF